VWGFKAIIKRLLQKGGINQSRRKGVRMHADPGKVLSLLEEDKGTYRHY